MRTENATQHFLKRPHSLVLIGVFIFLAAVVTVPLYSVKSSSLRTSSSKLNGPSGQSTRASQLSSMASSSSSRTSWSSAFSLLPIPESSPETIQTFASDCTTPKSTFVLGETVCAETVFVSETDRFVNWFGPSGHAFGGPGQTDITTNQPQDFLYTPTITGAWSVAIADSSNSSIVSTNFTVVAPGPIVTYKAGCLISSDAFILGEIVCARVIGGTGRRLTFVDPSGFIRQVTSITSDPQDISFQLPATNTSTINGQNVDNRGTWRANMITSRGSVVAKTEFVVTNPAAKSANLSISKTVRVGDDNIAAGSSGAFEIFVTNFGPDAAANVVLSDTLPAHTTFVGFSQTDGPTFACSLPQVGGTGTVSCTLASFARGGSASFTLAYTVDAGTAAGTQICNTATISSDISDPDTGDNSSQACITVPFSGSGGACTVSCPANITTTSDTTDQNGTAGAVVTYPAPTSSGPCGSITTDHCNSCFFPVGTTVVTATADTGDSCSFTVTVNNANVPNITCPANQTANADNNCEATVNLGTPTVSGGENVTLFAVRSDGQPMYDCDANGNCTRRSSDAPFPAGTTTITWFAFSHDVAGPYTTPGPSSGATFEEQHRTGSASCTQTVTVNDVTPPVIGATDQTISADASCQGTVPDYSSTVTDNCACASSDTSPSCAGHSRITVTQVPSAGTMLPPGQYPVVIVANDGSSNNDGAGNTSTKTITLTIKDTTPPTINCPANIITNTDPGLCSAVVNPGMATATDNCDSNPTITGTRSDNQPLNAPYPKGTTVITWTASDHASPPNQSSCVQTVTVVDNEPPVIVFNGQTPSMSPPDHKYHTFTPADFIASVSDNCDSISTSDVYITRATSDEPDRSAGSGNTTPDIVIASDCKSVQLRAERLGGGNGRVYTIYFKLKDTSGNFTTGTAKVIVPVEQGGTAVDDGPQFTVTSSCP